VLELRHDSAMLVVEDNMATDKLVDFRCCRPLFTAWCTLYRAKRGIAITSSVRLSVCLSVCL